MFHISDRSCFMCQLGKNGKRLVVGAPYYFGNGIRDGGYYNGKVKLLELQHLEVDGSDQGRVVANRKK